MAIEILFPRVDMDMTSGRVGRWLVDEGSPVSKGDPLFEIETDKAAMEVEAPATGILRGTRAAGNAEVAVGSAIGWIVAEGETWSPAAPEMPRESKQVSGPRSESGHRLVSANRSHEASVLLSKRLRATPLARREARRLGIDLDLVAGSGPRGRVVSGDLAVRAPGGADGIHRQWLGAATGTPLLFLHGFGADLTGWRPVWAAMDADLRILAIDLPGHGRSACDAPASLAGLVDAVQGVLNQERISSAHLIGHSLGGAVAMALAETGAIALRSLCLIAPAGLGPEIDGAFLHGFAAARRPESMTPWLRRLFADPALVTPALVGATLRPRADEARQAYQSELLNALFPDGTQAVWLRHVLDRLLVPCKLIWGVQDCIIPPRHASRRPGVVALHTLDCGHMPHLEQPRLIATLIEQLSRTSSSWKSHDHCAEE